MACDEARGEAIVPVLLAQVNGDIEHFAADGIYDREPVYAAVARHSPGCRSTIAPRKDAMLTSGATGSPSLGACTAILAKLYHERMSRKVNRFVREIFSTIRGDNNDGESRSRCHELIPVQGTHPRLGVPVAGNIG